MGIWGDGLFENDYALDFIGPFIDRLIRYIVYYVSDEALTGHPVRDDDQVLVAADMLYLWYEHYDIRVPVSRKVVRRWRELYLQRFYAQNYSGDLLYRRLNVIETIFDRLEAAAWEDD